MSNWTDNILVVSGKAEDVRRFYDENHVTDEQDSITTDNVKAVFTLAKLIPIPKELNITSPAHIDEEKKQATENVAKYGFPDWYQFCTHVWGTRWDVDSPESNFNDEGTELIITFATAWSPIEGWIEKAIETYDTLSFDYKSCDPAMDWHWEIHAENGEVTSVGELTMREAIAAGKWKGYVYDEWFEESSPESSNSVKE